jgi:2-dehydro-3-deoxygalactonokinase
MTKQILSCDWGTTAFRLRLINAADGNVMAETTEGKGIAIVHHEWLQSGLSESERINFYKNILQSHIEKLTDNLLAQDAPLIISGMASSTIGMNELPYSDIPLAITAANLNVIRIDGDENFKHDLLLVSGLKTNNDVMRGEETMLLGCDLTDEDTLIIFPGTHSKHVNVKNKVLVDFKTYMTGEVFDLLANKSILSKSVVKNTNDQYSSIFGTAVKQAATSNLLNCAFQVRTNQLFKKLTAEENYYYLSGLVIGTELKDIATGNYNIQLVCSRELAEPYLLALKILVPDRKVKYSDADDTLITGHCILANVLLK